MNQAVIQAVMAIRDDTLKSSISKKGGEFLMVLKIKLLQFSNFLFNRRSRKSPWFFLIAALPFFIFGLLGWEYGAFFIYLIPALLCILHFFYPTMFVWFIITALYCMEAVDYLYGFVNDILRIAKKLEPNIFVGFYDSVEFVIIIIVVVSITIGLFVLRPSTNQSKKKGRPREKKKRKR